jgi:hypothetical protein
VARQPHPGPEDGLKQCRPGLSCSNPL